MKENWGRPGMPPLNYEILDRWVRYDSETYRAETVFVQGYHPHLGKIQQGWSGTETVVEREIIKGPGPGMEMVEGVEYPIIRIKK